MSLKCQHTHMHKVRISFQTELMTCTSSAAGLAAAHVLPRLLLGIHKLRLIPAVWCHLHHLPQGVIFNMGQLLFHRALCWGGYICVISVQACIYLSTHVHVCVLMRLCEHVWVRTGEKSLLLCIFTRPPTGLFTWNITAEMSWTHRAEPFFLWCNNTLAVKAMKASAQR